MKISESTSPFTLRLRRNLTAIERAHSSLIASRSLASRDPSVLEALIRSARDLVGRVEQLPPRARGAELARLHFAARSSLKAYEQEHAEILLFERMSPEEQAFGYHATATVFIFERWARHAAERSSRFRDLGLLRDLCGWLEVGEREMIRIRRTTERASFARDLQIAAEGIVRLRAEIEATEALQASGTSAERAAMLVDLAEAQCDLYARHFVGRPRVTRRPALLRRVLDNLDRVRLQMRELELAGAVAESMAAARRLVEARIAAYGAELAEIKNVRMRTPVPQLLEAIAQASRDLVTEIDAIGREERAYFTTLPRVVDELGELLRQMDELGPLHQDPVHEEALRFVARRLLAMEREYNGVLYARRDA